ncbi:MAG: Coenzyme F420 hydrogenase/dehydrogenase, beta subunit C-terminal domain, partial [Desulforhabdus sp.]|nr:Coenzyme F420 hydrogenase/dehydrogenase, beta subunit C-terminal domain [Desulforhabdus sp.]
LGLFCTGNFAFGEEQRKKLEEIGDFKWDRVDKINIKENLLIHLQSGEIKSIALEQLDFMKRFACRYCDDYSAEYADISFGGIGAEQGWTTVITRSPVGRAIFANAKEEALEEYKDVNDPQFGRHVLNVVLEWSDKKKEMAASNREELTTKPVTVKS